MSAEFVTVLQLFYYYMIIYILLNVIVLNKSAQIKASKIIAVTLGIINTAVIILSLWLSCFSAVKHIGIAFNKCVHF